MSRHALEIERWVLDLLIVLKQESEAMTQVETWLSQLRESVIQRNESCLDGLLKEIQARRGLMPELEARRQGIRLALTTVLDLPFEQVTLTKLESLLTGELQHQVSCMKTQLQSQTRMLRAQHQGAVMFLMDCARFNRLLLNSVFDKSHQSMTTYTHRGNPEHTRSSALVNMQF
ncbi:MAG: hypothetical protein K9N55_00600 [Phycisphaerae bacterium]|nr:hypothetical protein [Phycisphaerae bacterium]